MLHNSGDGEHHFFISNPKGNEVKDFPLIKVFALALGHITLQN
jgi:hypothetical protein